LGSDVRAIIDKVQMRFGYRFGFNGYENEPDIAGKGSVIDFGARIYDSRLGRFFSRDPITYPFWSPYQYDGNSPIGTKDIMGMGVGDPDKHEVKSGESMSSIADGKNIPLRDLIAWNPQVQNPDRIYPGQKLNLIDPNGSKLTVLDFSTGVAASDNTRVVNDNGSSNGADIRDLYTGLSIFQMATIPGQLTLKHYSTKGYINAKGDLVPIPSRGGGPNTDIMNKTKKTPRMSKKLTGGARILGGIATAATVGQIVIDAADGDVDVVEAGTGLVALRVPQVSLALAIADFVDYYEMDNPGCKGCSINYIEKKISRTGSLEERKYLVYKLYDLSPTHAARYNNLMYTKTPARSYIGPSKR
jgi:RHS repeat-associated protein